MKLSTVIAAAGGALFIACTARAGFEAVVWEEVDSQGYADRTIDLFVSFDNSLDEINAVAGTVLNRLSIRVDGGTFYQNPFGDDTAPNSALFGVFPSLEYDSFVSIGLHDSLNNETQLSPNFPGFGASELGGAQDLNSDGQADGDNMVWHIVPGQIQGKAGQYPGERVLIARLSAMALAPGETPQFSGEFTIQGFEDGLLFNYDVGFNTIPAPGALALLGLAAVSRRRRRP